MAYVHINSFSHVFNDHKGIGTGDIGGLIREQRTLAHHGEQR